MHTILGAGGAIANELVRELGKKGLRIRLVGRNPTPSASASEIMTADLSDADQTLSAVSGSEVVYLLAGLKYELRVWRELWPRIMRNTIEACKRTNAKLVFFDNVYMLGRVEGVMTEETPFNPCSKKGEIRAQIATILLGEMKSGNLSGMIARSADFYGPGARTGVPNILVFDKLAGGKKAMWLANDMVRHSLTFTPDVGMCLALLSESDTAWGQTWHMPTASDPLTGAEFIALAAKEFGVVPKHRVLSRTMVKMAGLFDATVRETYEMLYQSEFEYIFDSTKYEKAFGQVPTSYSEGVRATVAFSKK
jgi:nucleoside-diphosphate-sugar epimerase